MIQLYRKLTLKFPILFDLKYMCYGGLPCVGSKVSQIFDPLRSAALAGSRLADARRSAARRSSLSLGWLLAGSPLTLRGNGFWSGPSQEGEWKWDLLKISGSSTSCLTQPNLTQPNLTQPNGTYLETNPAKICSARWIATRCRSPLSSSPVIPHVSGWLLDNFSYLLNFSGNYILIWVSSLVMVKTKPAIK